MRKVALAACYGLLKAGAVEGKVRRRGKRDGIQNWRRQKRRRVEGGEGQRRETKKRRENKVEISREEKRRIMWKD